MSFQKDLSYRLERYSDRIRKLRDWRILVKQNPEKYQIVRVWKELWPEHYMMGLKYKGRVVQLLRWKM